MITASEYSQRRQKLFESLKDDSITIVFSGRSKICSADETFNFVVNKNFYYLTGISQEDSALVLTKVNGVTHEYLFIQEYDETKEKWTGIRLKPDEAIALSGVKDILYFEKYADQVNEWIDELVLDSKDHPTIYLDLEAGNKIGELYTTKDLANDFKEKFDSIVNVEDVYLKIVDLRLIKSPAEIEEFRNAIHATNLGLIQVLKNIKPDMKEYQLAGLFEYVIRDYANCKTAFNTIAASGKNAVILHYPNPVGETHAGDLMLFDLGAQYNFYNADVSRTYPISGKYEGIAAKLYDLVLKANKTVAEMCAPGVTIAQLQSKTIQILSRGLLELGLIKEGPEVLKYYYHNVSHHIGLDTHDPAHNRVDNKNIPLVAGNVISDEPGLYIKELGIGIRIEDDLLVTENGCEVLTKEIAKERIDVENIISSK